MRARSFFALALGLLAISCAKAGAAPPSPEGRGLLVVTQATATDGPMYIEGYVPFVTVTQGERKVFSHRMPFDQPFTHELPSGEYTLNFAVRPCDGNCGNLDPQAEACSAPFAVAPDQTVKAHAIERPGQGCSISFPS